MAQVMGNQQKVIIIQRVVPHYRASLFEALYAQFGYKVVEADNFSGTVKAVQVSGEVRVPYTFFKSEYSCHVPLIKIVRQERADTLILEAGSTMTSTWLAMLWCLFPQKWRPKFVFWLHGRPVGTQKGIKSHLKALIKHLQMSLADGVLTYTEKDAEYLRKFTSRTPIVATNNTVDIAPMLALRKTAKPIVKTAAAVWLCVGRLTPDKKINDVIFMFKKFQQIHNKAQLYVVGDGVEMEKLAASAGDLLGENIHLVGAVYQETDIARYYNAADIFVLAGAAGLGVNHALAYGVPILAFDSAEHHPEGDYIIDGVTGWRVAPQTPEAMLTKLQDVFANKKSPKEQLGKGLTTYAEKNLSLQHMVDAFKDIVQKVNDTGASNWQK